MKISWTNHDRTALNEWLVSDLGKKFLLYLSQQSPDFPESLDMQQFAMHGAVAKGFSLALREIDKMGDVPIMPLPKAKFVEVEKD